MGEQITLEEIYNHPLVSEILIENRDLKNRIELSEKPHVDDLNNISLPYTIKNHLLIDEGVHNGIDYKAQILRMAIEQHENLSIFLDHHDNDKGGTTQTWVGEIRNPQWSEEDSGIKGDVDIVDPKSAMAIAYGAKWGISATVDVDSQPNPSGGSDIAVDPQFKSYSLVLDPAVRGTMLNEQKNEIKEELEEEDIKMSEEMKSMKADLKPALDKLDAAIKSATAKRDDELLVPLRQLKAILTKLSGATYPYPGEEKKLDEEIEGRFDRLEQAILALKPAEKEELKVEAEQKSEEFEALEKKNKAMQEQLDTIAHEKLAAYSHTIAKKELDLGLIVESDLEARRKELEAMDEAALKAVEQNVDKTIAILETEVKKEDEKLEIEPEDDKRKTLSKKKDDGVDHDRNLLDMMVKQQSTGKMEMGGY